MIIAFTLAYQAIILGVNIVFFVGAYFVIRKIFRWLNGTKEAPVKRVNNEKDLW